MKQYNRVQLRVLFIYQGAGNCRWEAILPKFSVKLFDKQMEYVHQTKFSQPYSMPTKVP